MSDCITAVEEAFIAHASGHTIPPGVLGAHVQSGGFHVKTAGLATPSRTPRFAAKINANFPGNRSASGLPTIQGILALFNADDGRVLALMDSIEITSLRTAAATAVAAKHLAPTGGPVTIIGCGEQSRYQLRALACVRAVEHVTAIDVDESQANRFAVSAKQEHKLKVDVRATVADAPRATKTWITCTSSHDWFLGRAHVAPGSFVAAVGADNPEKHEIEPELLAESAVVADILEQCATIGDLHHALTAGVMRREDVRAELSDVVSGRKRGRHSEDEIVVFDSTGTALQDVAAASLVYERAVATGTGLVVELAAP
jgi:ornithine cyclodeaminase/alanine dehydrogenase-like protein (mu-crystallin family)